MSFLPIPDYDSCGMNKLTTFCNVTELSRLVTKEELGSLRVLFQGQKKKSQNEREELLAFVEFLIEARKLTRWQTEMLLMGKHRGFFIGNFVLLDRSPKNLSHAVFKARERDSNTIVMLEVDMSSKTSDGKDIAYRVIS